VIAADGVHVGLRQKLQHAFGPWASVYEIANHEQPVLGGVEMSVTHRPLEGVKGPVDIADNEVPPGLVSGDFLDGMVLVAHLWVICAWLHDHSHQSGGYAGCVTQTLRVSPSFGSNPHR